MPRAELGETVSKGLVTWVRLCYQLSLRLCCQSASSPTSTPTSLPQAQCCCALDNILPALAILITHVAEGRAARLGLQPLGCTESARPALPNPRAVRRGSQRRGAQEGCRAPCSCCDKCPWRTRSFLTCGLQVQAVHLVPNSRTSKLSWVLALLCRWEGVCPALLGAAGQGCIACRGAFQGVAFPSMHSREAWSAPCCRQAHAQLCPAPCSLAPSSGAAAAVRAGWGAHE